MDATGYLSLGILLLLWGAQLKQRPFLVRHIRLVVLGVISALAIMLLWQTHRQFLATAASPPPLKYLIPPYTPLSDFLFSMWSRLLSRYGLALIVSGLFFGLVKILPKRLGERWFEPDEPYLIALGVILAGHPHWLLYLGLMLVSYLLYALGHTLMSKKQERVSLYHFWLPVAIVLVLLSPFLKTIPWLAAFTTGA